MAVQILNDMPDAEIHRGEPLQLLRIVRSTAKDAAPPRRFITGRAAFLMGTLALHAAGVAAFVGVQYAVPEARHFEPLVASLIDAPQPAADTPPEYVPATPRVALALNVPVNVSFESEPVEQPVMMTNAISAPTTQTVTPPMVETVEYVRPPTPVYPSASNRNRERGIVLLRVLVDSAGRPAQVQVERSSGFSRLDTAARAAVEKALFRPHEVNGVARPAQVLIPIEFTRRAT